MTTILNIGMNHETAPVEIRECLAAEPNNNKKALVFMRETDCIKESIFLSTCNRVEILCTTDDPSMAKKAILELMSKLGRLPIKDFISNLYTYNDMEAVHHFFSVASSLDSMIIGEPQILGQIKKAYAEATINKSSGVILNRLMHRTFHVAKKVRTETEICESAVSISYAAVELAKKIFYTLEGKKVLFIGTGEMAELAARHLMKQGISSIRIANRTFNNALKLAALFDGNAILFEEIDSQLSEVDIVLTSTASPQYIITYEQVKKNIRKRRNSPLFFIDIAVPRNVQPEVNNLENIYVYDIDDLKGIIRTNMAQRQQEAVKADRIVSQEVDKFEKWLKTLKVVPTIISLRRKADIIMQAEFQKSYSALKELSPAQMETVNILTKSIVEKLLNDPILYLKGKADRKILGNYLDMTRNLFNLDKDEDEI